MAHAEDVPKQVRVRTDPDDGLAHRYDAIESAADYYGTNKTAAIVNACDDVGSIVSAAKAVLERDDLTHEQREEIADLFNQARGVEFTVEPPIIGVEKG